MANKKILIEIKVNDKATPEVKKTDEAVKGLSSSVRILNKEQKEKIIIDEKAKIVNKAKIDALKREAAAQLQVTSATKGGKATSGLNNAILLETGRLASDASYGFQGMANNLGQLLSLFQTSAKNAGGFGAALKQVGSQLFGIGGILIGIQLLISFLPKLEKAFKNWGKETTLLNEVLVASAEIAGKSISRFEVLTEAVNDSSKSTKEKNLALKLLNKEYPDFNANILIDANNNEKASIEIENYIEILNKKAKAQAAQTLMEKAYTELILKQIEVEEVAQANGFKDYEDLVSQREEVEQKQSKTRSIRAKTRISDSKNLLNAELNSEFSTIESLEKRIESLKEFTFLEDDLNKKGLKDKRENAKALRYIEGGFRTTPEEEDKRNKAVQRIIEKGFGETFAIRKKGIKKESDLFFKDLKAKRDAKDKDAKKDVELKKATDEEILIETANFFDAASQLMGEHTAAGKAFAIITATIDTYVAANNALANIPAPANYIAAAATIVQGLANVKTIMNTGAPVATSATTGGSGVTPPAFNVVGTSETSQLAQAVGRGNQNSVVKAYVVGSEITSQQEFDRKITNTAGL